MQVYSARTFYHANVLSATALSHSTPRNMLSRSFVSPSSHITPSELPVDDDGFDSCARFRGRCFFLRRSSSLVLLWKRSWPHSCWTLFSKRLLASASPSGRSCGYLALYAPMNSSLVGFSSCSAMYCCTTPRTFSSEGMCLSFCFVP